MKWWSHHILCWMITIPVGSITTAATQTWKLTCCLSKRRRWIIVDTCWRGCTGGGCSSSLQWLSLLYACSILFYGNKVYVSSFHTWMQTVPHQPFYYWHSLSWLLEYSVFSFLFLSKIFCFCLVSNFLITSFSSEDIFLLSAFLKFSPILTL